MLILVSVYRKTKGNITQSFLPYCNRTAIQLMAWRKFELCLPGDTLRFPGYANIRKGEILSVVWRMIELWKVGHVETLPFPSQCGPPLHFLRWNWHCLSSHHLLHCPGNNENVLYKQLIMYMPATHIARVCIRSRYLCSSAYNPVLKTGLVRPLISTTERKLEIKLAKKMSIEHSPLTSDFINSASIRGSKNFEITL